MAFEFIKNFKELEAFFGSGNTKKSTEELGKYKIMIGETSLKIEKMVQDMERFSKVIKEHEKNSKTHGEALQKLKKRNQEVNKEYEEQARILEKLKVQNSSNPASKNAEEIKKQEKKLNDVLKERIKIDKQLQSTNKKMQDSQFKMSKAQFKYEKSSLEKTGLEKKLVNIKEMSIGSKGKKNDNSGMFSTYMDTVKDYSNLIFALRTAIEPLAGSITVLAELEKQFTSLGVVSGKSSSEIKLLRTELLKMGTDSIYSSGQLAESLEQIVRTGKTLEDARNIVEKTVGLATASFESLSFATMTVNKAMVSLGIQSEDAGRVVNTFHNIVLSTPLDLRTLDESLRQTASAFGTVVEFSGKSGEELETYKLEVLDTVSALTGSMALLGKTGLKIAVLYKFL